MRVSLNDLVSILSSRVGQQFNTDLQEEMKLVLNYKRADFFKKSIINNPFQKRFFLKDFDVPLLLVPKSECPINVNCEVRRSKISVPSPTRNNETLFDFVGSADKMVSFGYTTPEQYAQFNKYNKYTSGNWKYFYVNQYLYIYGDEEIEDVNARGLYPDPRDLKDFKCAGTLCYTDDMQYDVPDDLVNAMISDTLNVELRNQFPQQGEVQTDKSDKKTEQGGLTQDD